MDDCHSFPVGPEVLVLFVTYLSAPSSDGGHSLAPATVRAYVSAVSSTLISLGISTHKSQDIVWPTLLHNVLKGCDAVFGDRSRPSGEPMTVPILNRLVSQSILRNLSSHPLETRLFLAVVLCQFFAICRISELIHDSSSQRGLRLADLIAPLPSGSYVNATSNSFYLHDNFFLFNIDSSKTDHAGRGLFKPVAKFPDKDLLCPASALAAYARLRWRRFPPSSHPAMWRPDGLFFVSNTGAPFSTSQFRDRLSTALLDSGLDESQVSLLTTHSLRRGGCTALIGIPDSHALAHALGAWKPSQGASTIVKHYARPSLEQLMSAQWDMRCAPASTLVLPERPPPRPRKNPRRAPPSSSPPPPPPPPPVPSTD